jgi:cell division protease FtsH
VLQILLPDTDPLHKVTIIPRGRALGSTMSLPEKDRYGFGKKWLSATARVLCGGRIAELRHSGDASSGAAMDIEQVTKLARAMVLDWGMSEKLGFVKYSPDDSREAFFSDKPYSDETAHVIDDEVRRITDEAYHDAERILFESWDKIDAVAVALLKHETLDADEVRLLCRGETLERPSLSGILADETVPAHKATARPVASASEPPLTDGISGGSLPQPGMG